MASQRNTPKATEIDEIEDGPVVDTPDTDDDIPDIYNEGEEQEEDSMEASLAKLNGLSLNGKRDEENIKLVDPPAGLWEKIDRWDVTVQFYENDTNVDDISPDGRTIILISGYPKPRTVEGHDYCPRLFIRLSPDKREGRDGTGFDMAHKLYLKARETYLTLYKKKLGDGDIPLLIKMLVHDSFAVQTMKGDNGPVPILIKPLQKERQGRASR